MAAVLKGTIKRAVKIYGIEGMVNVSISEEGLKFAVPGTKQSVMIAWGTTVAHCSTPTNVPSYLFGNPKELLKVNAQNAAKKRAEREVG